jgi:hypothetical protein
MPNWKKLLTSGSDGYLNSLSVTTQVSASLFSGSFVGDGSGLTNVTAIRADNTVITVKNISGAPIQKGTPLYITGSNTNGNLAGVYPADAGNPLRMPAGAIAGETIAIEEEGIGLLNGFINEVNTTAFNSGDEVYVGVGGGYTNVAPTGSALIQKLGNVERSAVNGSGVINGPGTFRSMPNTTPGHFWVGSNNHTTVQIPTGSLYSGSYSGSFQGDGSQLTGITIEQFTTFKSNFTNQTSVTILHNLDTENLIVSVYDQTSTQIIPDVVRIVNQSEVLVQFITPTTGYIVLAKGGHIVSGSIEIATSASYVPFTGVDGLTEFSSSVSSSIEYLTNSYLDISSSLSQSVYKQFITGSDTYTVVHNLDEDYPFVQVWDTITKKQVIPSEVDTINPSTIGVSFEQIFTGIVIIKK